MNLEDVMFPTSESDVDSHFFRVLEEEEAATDDEVAEPIDDTGIIVDTVIVYGSAMVVIFLSFCWLRQKYPRPYTIRRWVEKLHTPLADESYGFFSWVWMIATIPEDEFMDQCGMDALCYVRLLNMGYRISLVGIFNSLWLIPVYATANESEATRPNTDRIVETTIGDVPEGSPRLLATSLASWVLFGYTMYTILKELEWFTDKRHKFLTRPRPRNYSVYVSDIPEDLRKGPELRDFFRECFSYESVLDADIRLHAKDVGALVAQRQTVVTKLEHAVAQEDATGKTPMHSLSLKDSMNVVAAAAGGSNKVESIPTYAAELKELNATISETITNIQATQNGNSAAKLSDDISRASGGRGGTHGEHASLVNKDVWTAQKGGVNENDEVPYSVSRVDVETGQNGRKQEEQFYDDVSTLASRPTGGNKDNHMRETEHSNKSEQSSGAKKLVAGSGKLFKGVVGSAAKVGDGALGFIGGSEDGEPFSGGFVTFSNLRTASAALQLLHHKSPHTLVVHEAPDPEDIFWFNVGRPDRELQIGRLLSLAATTALCLLWTIPVTFVASLSSVDALRESIGFIDDLLNAAPWLVPVFEVGAPLLLVIFNALLPIVLEIFSMLEGPVSGAVVEASLFSKLAYFMIIQTFFVSALSGTIMAEISDIVANPDPVAIVNLLATSLPAQSTFFMQLIFVSTTISCGMEVLRIVPLVKAFLRTLVGPKYTKKERQTTFMGLQPLADPLPFEHADFSSNLVLYFIVIFVYSVMSPLVNYFSAFCFAYMGWMFRHQFIYIYPAESDSGGKLWIAFIRITITTMFIGEFTIVGLLSLKQATFGIPFMVPLIITTMLFSAYINQQHFRVAENLPSRDALKQDIRHGDGFDLSFLKDVYIQPELQDKLLFPEINVNREMELDLRDDQYLTPDPSEAGD